MHSHDTIKSKSERSGNTLVQKSTSKKRIKYTSIKIIIKNQQGGKKLVSFQYFFNSIVVVVRLAVLFIYNVVFVTSCAGLLLLSKAIMHANVISCLTI